MYNKIFLLRTKCTTPEIRSQIINPTKTTALTTPLQTSIPSNVTPTPLSAAQHVLHQLLVFLRGPKSLPQLHLVVVFSHVWWICNRFPHLLVSPFKVNFVGCDDKEKSYVRGNGMVWNDGLNIRKRERKIKERRLHGVVMVMMIVMVWSLL